MGVFKLGLMTAFIYGAMNVLLFFGLIGLTQITGPVGIVRDPIRLGIFFGVIWIISFCLSWRLLRLG